MGKSFHEIAENIQERIRQVAYLMWESAGRQHGMAMEYWLAAETEVLKTMQAAAESLMPREAKREQPVAAIPAGKEPPAASLASPATPAPAPAPAAQAETEKPKAAKPAARKPAGRAKAKP